MKESKLINEDNLLALSRTNTIRRETIIASISKYISHYRRINFNSIDQQTTDF
jgi:hypothetical protein